MADITKTVAPKTDQLNADDFIGSGDKVIVITDVKATGAKDQPISIYYDGCNGKPWKPCLGMRRILIELWGEEASKEADKHYKGRTVVLYRDPEVKYGGTAVGGIRIRKASNIQSAKKVALTVAKARRIEFVVDPYTPDLRASQPVQETPEQKTKRLAKEIVAAIQACSSLGELENVRHDFERDVEDIKAASQKAYDYIMAADETKANALEGQ